MSLQMCSLTPKASARWSGVGLVLPGHRGAGTKTPVWKPAIWSRWNQLRDLAPTRSGPGAHMAARAVGGQLVTVFPPCCPSAPVLFLQTNSSPPLLGELTVWGRSPPLHLLSSKLTVKPCPQAVSQSARTALQSTSDWRLPQQTDFLSSRSWKFKMSAGFLLKPLSLAVDGHLLPVSPRVVPLCPSVSSSLLVKWSRSQPQ